MSSSVAATRLEGIESLEREPYMTEASSLSEHVGNTEHLPSEMIQVGALAILAEPESIVVSPRDIAGECLLNCVT